MKSYDEIANSVLERRDKYVAAKLKRMKTVRNVVISGVSVLFAGLIGFGVLKLVSPETTPLPDVATTATNTVQPTVSTANQQISVAPTNASSTTTATVASTVRTTTTIPTRRTTDKNAITPTPSVVATVTNVAEPMLKFIPYIANGYLYPFDGKENAFKVKTISNFRNNKADYDNVVKYIQETYVGENHRKIGNIEISKQENRFTFTQYDEKFKITEVNFDFKDELLIEFMEKHQVSGITYQQEAVFISHLSDMRYGVLFISSDNAEFLNIFDQVLYPNEWCYMASSW